MKLTGTQLKETVYVLQLGVHKIPNAFLRFRNTLFKFTTWSNVLLTEMITP